MNTCRRPATTRSRELVPQRPVVIARMPCPIIIQTYTREFKLDLVRNQAAMKADAGLGPISVGNMVNAMEQTASSIGCGGGSGKRRWLDIFRDLLPDMPVVGETIAAVAAWVSRVDEAAVRNTQDVDILIQRADLERAKEAMAVAGFVFRHVRGIDMFLDGPDSPSPATPYM